MKRILFVCAHRPNRSPSQRFRFEQYLNLLSQNNFSFKISFLISEREDSILYSSGNLFGKFRILIKSILLRIIDVLRAHQFDYIFIQREAFMLGTALFEKLFSLSKAKLIFDFDDSIWLPDSAGGNKNLAWLKNSSKAKKIIQCADIVVAGNNFLANYAEKYNNNVRIIPTTVDTDLFIPKPKNQPEVICIGWTGTFSTIKHFELVVPVLKQVKSKYGQKIKFMLISEGNYMNSDLDIESKAWSLDSEVADLQEIDIGLMPLPNDEWSKGKCGFKGLQYMALEIPTIMSPVGVNTEIIKDGVKGFLATTDEDWFNKICQLVDSHELRNTIGQQGRLTVIEKYSKKSQEDNFLALFT